MKRIIRRVVTVVTTETWSVVEDDEYDQATQGIIVPKLGPANGTDTADPATTSDGESDDVGGGTPAEEEGL